MKHQYEIADASAAKRPESATSVADQQKTTLRRGGLPQINRAHQKQTHLKANKKPDQYQ
ncbi:hypothetical protein ACFQ3P_34225 [Paraburkholderia sabiae]|uniref:Uncharacterized protein n=1 Tax=Paraburkholderia sabiae TaxID=273251 RepID=A0ABU9QMB4_9BURK|nr:hypothetical protein [Paraburkholderia sabiae]WJZ75692.1 hypothetical protein QEN71_07830 [Paraburkholderia sabiae]